jgi:DNA-binding IclR family transcriptional regulator
VHPVSDWTIKYGDRPPHDAPDRRRIVSSVLKSVDLVCAFVGEHREHTLTELAGKVGLPVPTAHRLLATLEFAGWVERDHHGRYRLSLRLAEIARDVLAKVDLREIASADMRELSNQTGETAYIVVREGDHAVCVERVESYNRVRVMSWDIGNVLPLYAGAAPLAILAFQEAAERHRILHAGALEPPIGGTLDPEEVEERLATIRSNRYAISVDETIPGIASIGAPIFRGDGTVAGAISIGGVASTMMGDRLPQLTAAILTASRTISAKLGFRQE